MTTHTPDDEVLSALLDAQPVGADAAHVAACRACQQRLGELRAAARLASTPPPHVRGDVREAAVARAVAEAVEQPMTGRAAAVTSLRDRPKRRAATATRRVAPLPAAAALVALVVAAGWMLTLTTGGGGSRVDSASRARQPVAGTNDAFTKSAPSPGGGAGLGESADAEAPQAAATLPAADAGAADGGDLGPSDDLAAISRRAQADLEEPRSSGVERPCRGEALRQGPIEWQAAVTYNAVPAVAYRVAADTGRPLILVLATSDCRLLGRRAA